VVGRIESADIILEHSSISRHHCALAHHADNGRLYVIDLKSACGTFIDGRRIDPHKPVRPHSLLHWPAAHSLPGATLLSFPHWLARPTLAARLQMELKPGGSISFGEDKQTYELHRSGKRGGGAEALPAAGEPDAKRSRPDAAAAAAAAGGGPDNTVVQARHLLVQIPAPPPTLPLQQSAGSISPGHAKLRR
jgi:hypothetical protein